MRIRIEARQRYSARTDDYFEWILDRLQPRPGDLVVDLGCGVGSIHPLLCARGVRAVFGVDVSKAMVAATQRQANERGLPVIAIEADAQRLPLPENTYDGAMANHMLFHVPDQRAALRELRRVLSKPHGRVVLTAAAPGHRSRLQEIHARAAEELGYAPAASVMHRFNLDHLDLGPRSFLPPSGSSAKTPFCSRQLMQRCGTTHPAPSTRFRIVRRMGATGRGCSAWLASTSRRSSAPRACSATPKTLAASWRPPARPGVGFLHRHGAQ